MVAAVEALRPLTIDDLADFPDDGNRREIITGELVVTPAPTPRHQALVGRLVRLIGNVADEHRLGEAFPSPVDVRLSIHDVVEPDIVYVSQTGKSRVQGRYIDGAPALVVEVMSPSTRRLDLVRKRALYARAGLPEYWIVDPISETVSIHRREEDAYVPVVGAAGQPVSFVLPELEIDLVKLFADLPPAEE
jgi:Uma2 family endonuclease